MRSGGRVSVTTVPSLTTLASVNGLVATPDGNFAADADQSYIAYLRANLKIAALNGVAGAADAFAYADAQAKRRNFTPYKWSV